MLREKKNIQLFTAVKTISHNYSHLTGVMEPAYDPLKKRRLGHLKYFCIEHISIMKRNLNSRRRKKKQNFENADAVCEKLQHPYCFLRN